MSNPSALFLSQHGSQVAGSCDGRRKRARCWWSRGAARQAHTPNAAAIVGTEQSRLAACCSRAAPPRGHRLLRSGRVYQRGGRRENHRAGADLAVILAWYQPAQQTAGEAGVRRSRAGGRSARCSAAGNACAKPPSWVSRGNYPETNAPNRKIAGMEIIAVERVEEAVNRMR